MRLDMEVEETVVTLAKFDALKSGGFQHHGP